MLAADTERLLCDLSTSAVSRPVFRYLRPASYERNFIRRRNAKLIGDPRASFTAFSQPQRLPLKLDTRVSSRKSVAENKRRVSQQKNDQNKENWKSAV
jgi:hypothetical protein